MKPIDKKDLPKLYVLVTLAIGVFGYFIYAMTIGAEPAPVAAKGTTKDAASGTTVASNTPGTVPAGGAPAPAAADQPAFDPRLYLPPSGGRDPFQPVGPTSPSMAKPQPVAVNPPPPVVVPPIFTQQATPRPERPRPASSLGDLLGNAGATQDSVKPIVLEPAPAPTMAVTGVVLGDPTSGNPRNVAIMRNGTEERRFVSVGDYVGNGYTVVAVHADGVEIQDKAGNRRVTIKLGQPGDNARAN